MTQRCVSFFSSSRLILPLRHRLSNVNVFRVVHGGAENDLTSWIFPETPFGLSNVLRTRFASFCIAERLFEKSHDQCGLSGFRIF